MTKLKKLSFDTYEYKMDFKKEHIVKYKMDLLTILYLSSINVLNLNKEKQEDMIKRIERAFLYLDTIVNHKDTRSQDERVRFKEALYDQLCYLKDFYVDFEAEDIDIEVFNEWLNEQK